MIYLEISGGLGNQMFQYIAGRALADKNKVKLAISIDKISDKIERGDFTNRTFELSEIFNLENTEILKNGELKDITQSTSFFRKIKNRISGFEYYFEKSLMFDEAFNKLNSPAYVEGYFQSEKFFRNASFSPTEIFQFDTKKLNNLSKKLLESNLYNAVAIHVRRGDYVSNQKINQIHGSCDINYYCTALNELNQDSIERVIVFSDDPNWCKKNLKTSHETQYVDWNLGCDSWQDMYLMTQCSQFIIANSSFSWWGAFLSERKDKKVIAPKQWFRNETKNKQTRDLIPSSWCKV